MYRNKTLFRLILSSGIFFLPLLTLAQSSTSTSLYQNIINKLMEDQKSVYTNPSEVQQGVLGAYLDVQITPPNPEPNSKVTITIESYLTDLYKAHITWSVNGTPIVRGIGKTFFTFQVGPSQEKTTVSLSITTNTGEAVKKVFSFSPLGVTTMWEADTYTPPFYKGKPLMSPQSKVRIIAIPDKATGGDALAAGNISYTWSKNGYVDSASSGYQKNVYSFTGPKPLTDTKISLTASTLDESSSSEIKISLPLTKPFISFYENDPLLGPLYESPIKDTLNLSKREVTLVAVPYFFSNERTGFESFKYSWKINNSPVKNNGRTITLRNDENVKGESLVSLSIRGISQNFQSADGTIRINFTQQGGGRPIF